ncbi:TVP38/TMEM64 family protein [Solibacillus sp. R5-41]|uniref:TVP38/TMEM64 family protein n=1 Tax=Solibacillus sp. R5-41 TaxID=2048654 RepID=UPI0012FD45C5|nr:VTT domain-containing protein [Solibacillus sp. R5-41]
MDLVEESSASVWISFLIMVGLAFVPAMPIPLIVGIIAANQPFWLALLISLGGTTVGCIGMFYLSRTILARWARKKVAAYARLNGFFTMLDRNVFLAILIGRLIPIMPSAALNAIAGITSMSIWAFTFATVIGKLPTMVAFTMAGQQFEDNQFSTIILVGTYMLLLVLIGQKLKRKLSS